MIVSGIVTGDSLDSYWPIISPSLVTVPEVFAKVNSPQYTSCFESGEFSPLELLPVIMSSFISICPFQKLKEEKEWKNHKIADF